MIFSASYATPANIATAKLSGSDVLLGFNEPNEKAQAANTVQVSLLRPGPLQNRRSKSGLSQDAGSTCQYGYHHQSSTGQRIEGALASIIPERNIHLRMPKVTGASPRLRAPSTTPWAHLGKCMGL